MQVRETESCWVTPFVKGHGAAAPSPLLGPEEIQAMSFSLTLSPSFTVPYSPEGGSRQLKDTARSPGLRRGLRAEKKPIVPRICDCEGERTLRS